MTSHFYIAWAGNKRREMGEINRFVDLNGIETVVEPFCGSAAFAFHTWKASPHLRVHLNDKCPHLYAMLSTIKRGDKQTLYDGLQRYANVTKEDYMRYNREVNGGEGDDLTTKWMLMQTYNGLRPGMPPAPGRPFPKLKPLQGAFPFDDMLERATLTNHDFRVVCDQYRNDPTAFLFIDPPYVNSCNDFYSDATCVDDVDAFYTYLLDLLQNATCKVMLVVNNALLMRLLFKDYIRHRYGKKYECTKRQTEHIIITNYDVE